MLEGVSLWCFLFAFALLHGASPGRAPWIRLGTIPGLSTGMRAGALVAVVVGGVLWARADSPPGAFVVAVASLSATGTVFVLLAPLVPRALWLVVLTCPIALALLVLLGDSGG